MYRTDDPVKDAERYYNEQEAEIEKLPVCSFCGEHITEEFAYYINDEWVCEECLRFEYRREVLPRE